MTTAETVAKRAVALRRYLGEAGAAAARTPEAAQALVVAQAALSDLARALRAQGRLVVSVVVDDGWADDGVS